MIFPGADNFPRLTAVQLEIDLGYRYSPPPQYALENDIGASGGERVSAVGTLAVSGCGPGFIQVSLDLREAYINWNNRYRYRLGFFGVYQLRNIYLFCNGVASEYQGSSILGYGRGSYATHSGINLDPNNRNVTGVLVGSNSLYPKSGSRVFS